MTCNITDFHAFVLLLSSLLDLFFVFSELLQCGHVLLLFELDITGIHQKLEYTIPFGIHKFYCKHTHIFTVVTKMFTRSLEVNKKEKTTSA